MPILPEERDAAMMAVKTEIISRLGVDADELHDDDFLAIANAAMNVLTPRMNRLAEQNRDLKNELKGLA